MRRKKHSRKNKQCPIKAYMTLEASDMIFDSIKEASEFFHETEENIIQFAKDNKHIVGLSDSYTLRWEE